jgi:hypothetical protein
LVINHPTPTTHPRVGLIPIFPVFDVMVMNSLMYAAFSGLSVFNGLAYY